MKKVKVILCTMILSIALVGNVFAGNTGVVVFSGFLTTLLIVLHHLLLVR